MTAQMRTEKLSDESIVHYIILTEDSVSLKLDCVDYDSKVSLMKELLTSTVNVEEIF